MGYLNIIIKNYDRVLLGAVITLSIVGTVMLYSASSSVSMAETGGKTDTIYLAAHLKRLFFGIIAFYTFILIDYRKFKPIAPYILFGAMALLLITKIIYIVKGISSPARWIYLGPVSIQTSDIARLSLIISLAAYIDNKRDQLKDLYNGFLPPVFVIAILIGLIVIQPDFSTAMMLGIICAIMLFIGKARILQLLVTGAVSVTIAIPIMLMEPYRRTRILSWFNGNEDVSGTAYQINQSLISLGNGGFFGLGLGNSMEKNLFLPTPHTDFIFAIIGEEIGLIGAIFILSLFLLIFQRGIRIAKECTDPFGVMLAVGISFSFILYAFVNVAVVTNILPVTGLPMPMISYGGSGMVINLASMGILLNISQAKRSVLHRTGWKPRLKNGY